MTVLEQARPVPAAEAPAPRSRRRTSSFRPEDAYAAVGAAIAALSLSSLAYTTLLPLSGSIGFVLLTWALFVVLYAVLASLQYPMPVVKDKVAGVLVQSVAVVIVTELVVVIGYDLQRGWTALQHSSFWTDDLAKAGPLSGVGVGGVAHGAVATLEQLTLTMTLTVPLGLACAVSLNELPGRFSRVVRTVVEAMTALPSVVAGLFIFAAWILLLHQPKSGLAASLALTVMALPIVIRSADVVLRLVPSSLKEASYALGSGQWRTLWHVTLPTARSGLATAVILGAARAVGETSPVLLTAGYGTHLNSNPFSGPQPSLPLIAYTLTSSPQPTYIARGFGATAMLLLIVLVLFVLARAVGGRGPGVLSRRQQARAVRRSKADVRRYESRSAAVDLPDQPDEGPNV